MKFVEDISSNLDKGLTTIGVYIDLKTVNTINHSIVFKKLHRCGIRGIALIWIDNDLLKRKQLLYIME